MLRYFFLFFALACVCVISLAGFRDSRWLPQRMTHPPIEIFPDMDHQPKYLPQHTSTFFADGRAAREHIPGTIPIGYNLPGGYYQTAANNRSDTAGFSNQPDYYNTGKMGKVYGDGIPVTPVDEKLMARGKERFEINCAICHGKTALGDGIIKSYGLVTVANLQDPRIQAMPDGQIFSTITNGKNTMGAYGPQIAVEDRWAIITYLRALQKSQNVKLAELTQDQQTELKSKK
jgi:mono/diheme cytochrome c family protein